MLERFGHGGDLATASELFGEQRGGWLDFSANMNPFGPPECVGQIIRDNWRNIQNYPDPAVRGLRKRLGLCHGISSDHIMIGNGAAELIELSLRALKPQSTLLLHPCFSEYKDAALKAGSSVIGLQLKEENGFQIDAAVLEQAASDADCVVVGQPNNPTGTTVDPELLLRIAKNGCFLIVDEAFIEFSIHEERLSLIGAAVASDKILVIRSMTKFYSIPGLRLGYAAGSAEMIGTMRLLQVPWSVNTLAQMIGEAVLADDEYGTRIKKWLPDERTWLANELRTLGLTVFEGAANFILFALPESGWTAGRLQQCMGRCGILIRNASGFIGLNERYCRVAVRLREDNMRLIATLHDLLRTGS